MDYATRLGWRISPATAYCSATRRRSTPSWSKPPGTWNLLTAMADEAIDWITRIHRSDPRKPIFIEHALGAMHRFAGGTRNGAGPSSPTRSSSA